MKPQELFLAGGKSAGVWYCDKCHLVKRTKEEAEQCCRPRHCDSCGCEVDRFITTCGVCQRQKVLQRDLDALEKAELVEDWDGWVWHPMILGYHDGYCSSPDEMRDYIADLDEDEAVEAKHVEFAFCCKSRQLKADLEDLLQHLDDEGWEEMTEHASGIEDLEAAIDKFNDRNKDTFTVWEVDMKRKVRL